MEKLAGTDAVLTVFPNILEAFLKTYGTLPIKPQRGDPTPEEILRRLTKVPYFAEAYDENGIRPEHFAAHPALAITAASFVESMEKIERFAVESTHR